jgi:hypothetical protein
MRMNKLILLSFLLITFFGTAFSQSIIKDGLYLVNRVDTVVTQTLFLSEKETAVYFSSMFDEFNSDEFSRVIIDTSQYVPLELDTLPKAEQQTDSKKKLLLSLTKESSKKLKAFTTENLLRKVALIVGGEVLTIHKIKAAITNGQLQITRCNDNACETLLIKLMDNVVK